MIEFVDVDKSFGDKAVLRGLSFEVEPGEVYTLLGANGAGKTTAINILCNLLDADGGTVRVDGMPAGEATRRRLGVAPQEISLYLDLTCRENLAFFAEVYGIDGGRRQERVAEVLETLGLGPWAETRVEQLSGGWRRRMNLAVALVPAPAVLVLDEPTAGLDVESRHETWGLIERLRASGVAILLTTHLMDEAERLSHRVGILKDGRIVAEGSIDELRSRIASEQVAVVESGDQEAVRARARDHGWQPRRHAGRMTLWLPRRFDFPELVGHLDGVPLASLALHEIGLEHVYVELTGGFEPIPTCPPAGEC